MAHRHSRAGALRRLCAGVRADSLRCTAERRLRGARGLVGLVAGRAPAARACLLVLPRAGFAKFLLPAAFDGELRLQFHADRRRSFRMASYQSGFASGERRAGVCHRSEVFDRIRRSVEHRTVDRRGGLSAISPPVPKRWRGFPGATIFSRCCSCWRRSPFFSARRDGTTLPAWPANAQRELVDALRRYPLSRVWSVVASGQASGTALPTDYFCWSESSLRIAKLSLPLSAAQGDWLGAWQHAPAANPCAEVAAELTEL